MASPFDRELRIYSLFSPFPVFLSIRCPYQCDFLVADLVTFAFRTR